MNAWLDVIQTVVIVLIVIWTLIQNDTTKKQNKTIDIHLNMIKSTQRQLLIMQQYLKIPADLRGPPPPFTETAFARGHFDSGYGLDLPMPHAFVDYTPPEDDQDDPDKPKESGS